MGKVYSSAVIRIELPPVIMAGEIDAGAAQGRRTVPLHTNTYARLQHHSSYVIIRLANQSLAYQRSRLYQSYLTILKEQFTEFYYKTFDENRAQLHALYVMPSLYMDSGDECL